MRTIQRILCPVDFSEPSTHALRWASTVARRHHADLIVLSVVEPLLAKAAEARLGMDLVSADTGPALRAFIDAVLPNDAGAGPALRPTVRVGNAANEILRSVRQTASELIVMGSHGRGGLRKLLLGSTTEKVLQQADVPVLAVPAGMAGVPAADAPGVLLKGILAATDFGPGAAAAARWAADLARAMDVPLILAHVVEPVLAPGLDSVVADVENERAISATQTLTRMAGTLGAARVTPVVSVGDPADTLAALAVEHESGLVVMGLTSQCDAVWRRPGSIAYRVLRLAHTALLVVPSAPLAPPDAAGSRAVTRRSSTC